MKRSKHPISRRTFTASGLSALASLGVSGLAFAQAQGTVRKPIPPEVEKANLALVNDFCTAWGRKDMVKIAASLADTCTFRLNQTRPPIVGKQAVVAAIKGFVDRGVDLKILKSAVLGPVVLNERDDFIAATADQPARTIHVHAGMFFVQDGLIVEWTDYSV